jgi:hypothetical protein
MSVKRNEFIQHLATYQCYLHRHGSKHDIYQNAITKKKTTFPRHPKLKNFFVMLSASN